MIKETHVGLVTFNLDKTKIESAMYRISKFDRNLGDVMTIDGKKYIVGVIADNKNEIIDYLNSLISLQNKNVRKSNKIENRKADLYFAKIMQNVCKNIQSDLNNITL